MFKSKLVLPTIVFPFLLEKYNVRMMLLGALRACLTMSNLHANG